MASEDMLDQLLSAAKAIAAKENQSEKKSIIENNSDSSDEESNRDCTVNKYNECGKEIKALLRTDALTATDKQLNAEIKSSWKQQVDVAKKSTSWTKQSVAEANEPVMIDPFFGIRITKPLISSAVLAERMQGRKAITMSAVRTFVSSEAQDQQDWVIAGVVVQKSVTYTGKNDSKYLIWTLSDLKEDLKSVGVFLFKSAYKEFWKTAVGTVVGILNPDRFDNRDNAKEATLAMSNHQKIMVFGQSKDYGVCASKRKNGEQCTAFVNKSRCTYCIYHVRQAYSKCSQRSDLSNARFSSFHNKLFNKTLGKRMTPESSNARMSQKSYEKDRKRLEELSRDGIVTVAPVNRRQDAQKPGVATSLDVPRVQRFKDLERIQKLNGLSDLNKKSSFDSSSEYSCMTTESALNVLSKVKDRKVEQTPKNLSKERAISKKDAFEDNLDIKKMNSKFKASLTDQLNNLEPVKKRKTVNETMDESKQLVLDVLAKVKEKKRHKSRSSSNDKIEQTPTENSNFNRNLVKETVSHSYEDFLEQEGKAPKEIIKPHKKISRTSLTKENISPDASNSLKPNEKASTIREESKQFALNFLSSFTETNPNKINDDTSKIGGKAEQTPKEDFSIKGPNNKSFNKEKTFSNDMGSLTKDVSILPEVSINSQAEKSIDIIKERKQNIVNDEGTHLNHEQNLLKENKSCNDSLNKELNSLSDLNKTLFNINSVPSCVSIGESEQFASNLKEQNHLKLNSKDTSEQAPEVDLNPFKISSDLNVMKENKSETLYESSFKSKRRVSNFKRIKNVNDLSDLNKKNSFDITSISPTVSFAESKQFALDVISKLKKKNVKMPNEASGTINKSKQTSQKCDTEFASDVNFTLKQGNLSNSESSDKENKTLEEMREKETKYDLIPPRIELNSNETNLNFTDKIEYNNNKQYLANKASKSTTSINEKVTKMNTDALVKIPTIPSTKFSSVTITNEKTPKLTATNSSENATWSDLIVEKENTVESKWTKLVDSCKNSDTTTIVKPEIHENGTRSDLTVKKLETKWTKIVDSVINTEEQIEMNENSVSDLFVKKQKTRIAHTRKASKEKILKLSEAEVPKSVASRKHDTTPTNRVNVSVVTNTTTENGASMQLTDSDLKLNRLKLLKSLTMNSAPTLSRPKDSLINLNESFQRRITDRNKLNALAWVQKNGPISKNNPTGAKKSGMKRPLDNADNSAPKKTNAETVSSERFKTLMAQTSTHANLVDEYELEQKEKYFEKLETREKMEETMMSTYKVKCKAVKCLNCKYTSFSAADRCKSEKHVLKVFDATKRFFRCTHCGNRTVSLDVCPLVACNQCGQSAWERTTMMKQKTVQIGETLSIRGGDQTYFSAEVANANLNLLVPD